MSELVRPSRSALVTSRPAVSPIPGGQGRYSPADPAVVLGHARRDGVTERLGRSLQPKPAAEDFGWVPQGVRSYRYLVHRVLIVDDRPEIRVLVRARLRMLDDVEIVGEASNGAEALILVAALAPEAVVLDLEMPVMGGDEAIPRMRELAPGVRILLYAGNEAPLDCLSEAAQPDAIVRKGGSLTHLVDQLRALLEMAPYDVLRVALGTIPLEQAMTVFDTWVGLNVSILESLARGDELLLDQLGGATPEELQALIGLYAHLGDNLQKAAGEQADEVVPIVHLLRTTAAAARRALVALDDVHLKDFYAAWNCEVPAGALAALNEMRDRLMDALPTSSADETDGEGAAVTGGDGLLGDQEDSDSVRPPAAEDRAAAAIDRAAAAIDRVAAEEDRAAASIDELTGTYLRGPGHVELKREISRARREKQPLALAFVDVDGLKAVNDSRGHGAGDELLRDVAEALRNQLREYDIVVRHGGDEFLCALPGMGIAEGLARMELVHTALDSSRNPWTVSVGLAALEDEDSLDTLINRADEALYVHRANGYGGRVGA